MNNLTMIGRLTDDPPEITTTPNGHRVVAQRVAVNRPKKPAVFVDVKCWDTLADNATTYLTKGSQVGVTGELAQDECNDATTGDRRSRTYVLADRIDFLDHRLAPAASTPDPGQTVAAGP